MLVRFLSNKRKEIVTGFIGLIPVQEATGKKIFSLIDEEIKRCGQSVANCIGFATDGASNLVSCNNSLWSRLFNIWMKWEELKAYLTSAELTQSQFDTKFKARLLKEMLSDYKNDLFFEFATPVV
jgi:hypothetical protein